MFTDDKKTIGKIIQKYRKKSKLTQAELSEKIDLSEKHISKIESGIYYPSLTAFFKMIETLKIDLNEFGFQEIHVENELKTKLLNYTYSLDDVQIEFILDILKQITDNYKINHK